RCHRTGRLQLMVELLHRRAEIPVRTCPSGRMDPGRAAQSINRKPRIIGKSRQVRRACGGLSLYPGVFPKTRSRLVGLDEATFAGRNCIDAERFQQGAQFPQLAGIVGRNHQPSGDLAMGMSTRQGYITASFCSSMSLAVPLRARPSSTRSWVSVNGAFSAVVWISTMPPL